MKQIIFLFFLLYAGAMFAQISVTENEGQATFTTTFLDKNASTFEVENVVTLKEAIRRLTRAYKLGDSYQIGSQNLLGFPDLTKAYQVIALREKYLADRDTIDRLLDTLSDFSINAQSQIDIIADVQGLYVMEGKNGVEAEISIYWNAGISAYIGTVDGVPPTPYDVIFYNYDHFLIVDFNGEGDLEFVRDPNSHPVNSVYLQVGLAAGESGKTITNTVNAPPTPE